MLVGKRTILFNLIAALPVILEVGLQVMTDPGVSVLIPAEYLPLYTLAVTVGNVVLRAVTKTPVFQTEVKADQAE